MDKKTPIPGPAPQPRPESPTAAAGDPKTESRLLANISHEMRIPMDAILGYVELLGDTTLSDAQQTFVSAIERAARGLLDIMDDVLNLSRTEAGKLVIHNQPFSIRDCIDSVSQLLAPSAYRKQIDFIRLVDFDVPVNFIGDPLHIRQILVNLIGNAIKFTETGQVRLRVSAHPFDEQRFELVIQVSDTGIGITEEDMQNLFKPFSQPARPQGDIAGTGLGLVISKALCETMGGNIAVHSTPGIGSTFCVRIPLESLQEVFQNGDSSDLLTERSIAIVGADAEQTGWIAEYLRLNGATTRTVPSVAALACSIDSGCTDDIAVCFVSAGDLDELEQIGHDWARLRDRLPVLSLVSSVSGHTLRKVSETLTGDAIPAHSSAVTVGRHLATLLQQLAPAKETRTDRAGVPQILTGLQLLVADDNQFSRDYLHMLLSRHGAAVDVCRDGADACRLMTDHRYDLVLMDVRMPRCDGIEAMRQMIDSGVTLPPIIGLTAAPEECCRALDSGMTDCLLKPVRPAVLLKYISNHRHAENEESARPLSFIDAEMRDDLNVELPRRAADLSEAISRGDLTAALDAAHKISGTAALCGFGHLHSTAASIEGLIRQQHIDGIERLTRDLGTQIDEALASISGV